MLCDSERLRAYLHVVTQRTYLLVGRARSRQALHRNAAGVLLGRSRGDRESCAGFECSGIAFSAEGAHRYSLLVAVVTSFS